MRRNRNPTLPNRESNRTQHSQGVDNPPKDTSLLVRANRDEVKSFRRVVIPFESDRRMAGIQRLLIEIASQGLHLGSWGAAMLRLYIFSGASIPVSDSARTNCASTNSVKPSKNARFCSSASDKIWCLW